MTMYVELDQNGELVAIVASDEGLGAGHSIKPIPSNIPLEYVAVEAGQIVADYTLANREKVDSLRATARSESALHATSDKDLIYARKAIEVLRWELLSGSERLALTVIETKSQFPFAHYDSVKFGDCVGDAIARFESGAASSIDSLAQIEAQLQYDASQLPK